MLKLVAVLKSETLRAILRELAILLAKSGRARSLDFHIDLLGILLAFKDLCAIGCNGFNSRVQFEFLHMLRLGYGHDPTWLQGVIQLLYQEVYIDLEGAQLAPQPFDLHLLHLIQLHSFRANF